MWDVTIIDFDLFNSGVVPEFVDDNDPNIYSEYLGLLMEYKDQEGLEPLLQQALTDDFLKWVEMASLYRNLAYDLSGREDINSYIGQRVKVMRDLLLFAGYHLGGMLNQIFDQDYLYQMGVSENKRTFNELRDRELMARIQVGLSGNEDYVNACDQLW
jgi:hypothetical protein